MKTTGFVTCRSGKHVWVKIADAEVICLVRGKLKERDHGTDHRIVIGDKVEVTPLQDGSGLIESIAPRRTVLMRPGYRGKPQPIAANIDQLVIVQSVRLPNLKRQVVERFIALALRGHMTSLIVLNKCDLVSQEHLASLTLPLKENRVPIIHASVVNRRGIEDLRTKLTGRISAMVGQSGVGKSSLLNALFPELNLSVSTVSRDNDKGRHTTTSSRLYELPTGGYVADTPGIRSLALFDDQGGDVTDVFPEIQALAQQCRFRDCTHRHEPDCAVRSAVQSGAVDAGRLRSYVHLRRQTAGRR